MRSLFEKFGSVSSAKVISHGDTGRSRGFGFVKMDSTDEGNATIKGLHNKEIDGRMMSVSVPREKTERSDRNDRDNRSDRKRCELVPTSNKKEPGQALFCLKQVVNKFNQCVIND